MTLTGERAAEALRKLDLADVDNITELDARGDEGWEGILGPIRDAVARAYELGEEPDVRDIGEGLVPSMDRQIIEELLIVGAAYEHEVEADTTGLPLCRIVGQALAEVYTEAAERLVAWVAEQEDEDENETATCRHCHEIIARADEDDDWVDGDGFEGCSGRTEEGPHEPEDDDDEHPDEES